MNVGPRSARRRASAAIAAGTLAMAGGIFSLGIAPAGATHLCAGSSVLDIEDGVGGELYDVYGYDVQVRNLTEPLSPGQYTVDTWSYDGFVGRATAAPERSERWYAEFLDADGNVVGHTGATSDLADDVDSVESNERFEMTLTGAALQVRLILVKDFESLNLVHIDCLGFSRHSNPTTTEVPTPTTEVPTPTTEAPTTPQATPAVAVAVTTRTLPITGSNALPLTIAGLGLILTGAGLVAQFRPREI